MQRNRKFIAIALTTIFLGTLGCAGSTCLDPTPATLSGGWEGDAEARVTWAREQRIPIALSIAHDGHVHGTVGAASVVDGYLAKNRSGAGRALDINSDYIVRGKLDGVVIPGEPVTSKVLFIPFNLVEHEPGVICMEGGLTTCKSESGGGKDVAVAAVDLKLERVAAR